jgi:hypothetical protein
MTKNDKILKALKTSTGTLKFSDLCEQLLELEAQKKTVEDAIKLIKNSINDSDKFPYQSDNGEVRLETRGVYEQDVRALYQALPEDVFFAAASISKSKLSDDKEEAKKLKAIVELNTRQTGESEYIKVYLTKKDSRVKDEAVKVKK